MEKLSSDWLTEGVLDFEYKKYTLLAYLKEINRRFNRTELYPSLSDLVFHYRNLIAMKESKSVLASNFPKRLNEADVTKLKLTYTKMVKDDEVMQMLEDIISYAEPKVSETIDKGKEIHEFVEDNISLESIGLTPLYKDEGYLLLNEDGKVLIKIYRYKLTLFENADERFRGLSLAFLEDQAKSITNTFENIKRKLAEGYQELPNPATYLALSRLSFSTDHTILPVAKRMLMRQLAAA
ncbi:MAG: hypothetical protein AAF789_04405 [Bacteroidota bacterium]